MSNAVILIGSEPDDVTWHEQSCSVFSSLSSGVVSSYRRLTVWPVIDLDSQNPILAVSVKEGQMAIWCRCNGKINRIYALRKTTCQEGLVVENVTARMHLLSYIKWGTWNQFTKTKAVNGLIKQMNWIESVSINDEDVWMRYDNMGSPSATSSWARRGRPRRRKVVERHHQCIYNSDKLRQT